MAFESELFVGKIVCRFKGINCPANPSACKTSNDFFKKKRCTFQVLVQGKFKEEVRADLILTGGEFHKPFTERPPHYLVSAGCKFFAALTPGLELDLLCDEPYYTATLGGTVTTLSVDAEGEEPDALSDVKERNGRMGGAFSSDQKKAFPRRKRRFRAKKNPRVKRSQRPARRERPFKTRTSRVEQNGAFPNVHKNFRIFGRKRRFRRAAVSRVGRPSEREGLRVQHKRRVHV
jgi:hypothetical protein